MTKTLRFFEEKARPPGERTISVGSAEGYVERFHKKSGFKPRPSGRRT